MEKIFSYKVEVAITSEGRNTSDDALLKKFERHVLNFKINRGNAILSVKNLKRSKEEKGDFSDDRKLFVEKSEDYYLKVRKRIRNGL